MNAWWVRTEESYSVGSQWHGPYPTVEAAQQVAAQFSRPDAKGFAEVVRGAPGSKGTRIREFFRGMDFLPGESGYYPTSPPMQIDIPAGVGGA